MDAIRGSGFPVFVCATPHGVGLEHTADPKPAGRLPGAQWDTVHIVDDGFETLASADFGIIVTP